MKKTYCVVNLIILFSLAGTSSLFCFEKKSTEQLLAGYLKNDTNLRNLTIEVQKSVLSKDLTQINNGVDVSLSTGNVTLRFADDNTEFSVNPSVSVKAPQYNNFGVTVATELSNENIISDASLSLSADIISSAAQNWEISLLKAERSVLEAKRKLQKAALTAEKSFYSEINSLLKSTINIINDENSFYSDKLDFEAIKARGFTKTSSSYRRAEMKVLSDEHNIEIKKRSLIHDYIVFYKKCGLDIQLEMNQDFMELIPSDIQDVQVVDILSFEKSLYTSIESEEWTYHINSLVREAQKDFSLGASAGYTFQNSATKSDTIDAGLSANLNGITASAKLSVPLEKKGPVVTFSASVNPNNFKKNKIEEQKTDLLVQQELLNIESAYSEYENQIVKSAQDAEDLIWSQKTNDENLLMYESLEKDLKGWFAQGIVSETEYLSAKKNHQLYSVQKIMNQIEVIIYNNEIKGMFLE